LKDIQDRVGLKVFRKEGTRVNEHKQPAFFYQLNKRCF